VPVVSEEDPIVEKAYSDLREGIGRSREIAAKAKVRLSEITSDGPYPGPASLILADEAVAESPPALPDPD
jgi:hypothetical protein